MTANPAGKTVLQIYTDSATRERIERIIVAERRRSLSDVLNLLVAEALDARDAAVRPAKRAGAPS